MAWDDQLTNEQKIVARHTGSPARLLAGPGTGKTRVLSRRIQYLIQELNIPAEGILALTFTRAAAHELRQRLQTAIPEALQPRVSTLHSFALRQLLRNSSKLFALPAPLRIADDWEERHVILEDVKALLGLPRIRIGRDLFSQLSSDWETLAADQGMLTPDPRFIGVWQEHRKIFGYTLRSELVYQLKRALERLPEFQLEAPTSHLLIDEYQDLNRCDLEVVRALAARGPELYVAGDDDQSIYGFRKAHPGGIRDFQSVYPAAADLRLRECKRCDVEILKLGEFIADLDTRRIPKGIVPEPGRPAGEVALLHFQDNWSEASALAALVKSLVEQDHIAPHEILILIRVDTRGAFSTLLAQSFEQAGVPYAVDAAEHNPLDANEGRQVLSILRLLANPLDHLSWRALLKLRKNGVGDKALTALYASVRGRGLAYSEGILEIEADPAKLPKFGHQIQTAVREIRSILGDLSPLLAREPSIESLGQLVRSAISSTLGRLDEPILLSCVNLAIETDATSIQAFLASLESRNVDIEPEILEGKVNILTMHKAKGLTATAVIIVAAEDEHIPGRQDKEPALGDERRLLYVSLTRAKRALFITYCSRRTGAQRMLGLHPGKSGRTLSQFLRDAPIKPQDGIHYINSRIKANPEAA